MSQIEKHDLPNYRCQEYLDLAEKWRLIKDVFDGPTDDNPNKHSRYLPKESAEPPEAYKNRLLSAVYLWQPRFKRAISDFAGLMSVIDVSDKLPSTINDRTENIDGAGKSLNTLVSETALAFNKYGGYFWLVDYQGVPTAETAADESLRYPYVVPYEAEDIINWEFAEVNGVDRLIMVVIEQCARVKVGLYGSVLKTYYRVLTPGFSELWEIIKDDMGVEVAKLVEEPRVITDRSGKPLTEIPIVYFGDEWGAQPPLYSLAALNIHLLQAESDQYNVIHKCVPTPVIEDDTEDKIDGSGNPIPRKKIVLGPNTWVSVSKGGSGTYMEPKGNALAAMRNVIKDIKESMNRLTLDFLFGQVSATATQSSLQASGTQSNIRSMARQLNSGLSEFVRVWSLFTLEPVDGFLKVNEQLIRPQISADEARFILALMESGRLTYETGMSELKRGKWLSDDIDIAAEALKSTIPLTGTALVVPVAPNLMA
jgi:Domain of unknown function (DUF4055)